MKYWNARIRLLDPYTPGEQPKEPGWIKLNTNENPFPPSPAVREAIGRAAVAALERYPDPEADIFREAAARYIGVPKEFIFAGNGSDELLAFAFGAFFADSRSQTSTDAKPLPLLFSDITYGFYRVYADLWSLPFEQVPVRDDFSVSVDAFRIPCAGIVLCNPNAPTGMALEKRELLDLVEYHRARETLVLVDEAYAEFGAESVATETLNYENLLVIRTLSKAKSLAGLRAGYAVGNPVLIEGLRRIRNMFNSYTLGTVTQQAAIAALDDTQYYSRITRELVAVRKETSARLTVEGWHVLPSSTNFLFMRCAGYSGAELYEAFRKRRVLVRYWEKPRIRDFIRVSVGSRQDMETFCGIAVEIRGTRESV